MVRLRSSISMNNSLVFKLLITSLVGSLIVSCKKAKVEPYKPWGFNSPSYFPAPTYTFANNKQTYEKFVLGRALFYETMLSSDQTVSCGTCHANTHGFAGHNTSLSAGVNGLLGTRNSPSIANLAWSTSFMWDGGINHIEIMPVAPLTNPVEMNESFSSILSKLQNSEKYKKLFKDAYGTEQMTEQKILKALTQFMVMIVSDNSKYDRVVRGEDSFTAYEQEGYALFQQKCSQCHTEPLFTDHSFRNNGLEINAFNDEGRFLITQNDVDRGKFKVPSLRNVALTYPYMHDGRFYTLSAVLDHYSSGIHQSNTLDPSLQSGIPLTGAEKSRIIDFLKTLNDYELTSSGWLAEPK